MALLNLPPNHPEFPSPAILHAICALGSLYTKAVPQTPLPDKNMGACMSKDNQLNSRLPNHDPFQMTYLVAVTGRMVMLILSPKGR